jgi:hypothetical protein
MEIAWRTKRGLMALADQWAVDLVVVMAEEVAG